jgi:hypothetical protein
MGKIHGRSIIVSMSHKFNILALVASIEPKSIIILTINILNFFPICFKGVNMSIHLVFTFQKTFKPFVFTISVSFWNSRWHLGELEKYA